MEIPVARRSDCFDLALTLECGQMFRWTRVGKDAYEVVARDRVFRLTQTPTTVKARGNCDAAFLRHYLALDDDYPAIFRSFGDDPVLTRAVTACRGLRVLHQDPWEMLVSFVLSACSNIPRITQNIRDLCRAYGSRLETPWGARHAFPAPAQLVGASEQALRALGLGYRAKYLVQLVELVAADPAFWVELRAGSLPDARHRLEALPGVGPKVASCVALFGLDFHGAVPVDMWMLKVVRAYYLAQFQEAYPGRPLNVRWALQWAEQYFGPHAGIAQEYLFTHARATKLEVPPKPGKKKKKKNV